MVTNLLEECCSTNTLTIVLAIIAARIPIPTDKVEPRGGFACFFCFEYERLSLPGKFSYFVFEQVIKASNSILRSVARPLIWSTDKLFNGLEAIQRKKNQNSEDQM
uniref:Uncharacterized protein n=1 Tax=Tetranychus urticae TaxID=32264 RepID=T1KH32_TETUR